MFFRSVRRGQDRGGNSKKTFFSAYAALPDREFRITLSTILTILRIMLAPCIVTAMVIGWWGYAFFLFILAAATDLFDGMIARYWNQRTFLGSCLDPLADKCLMLSCFIGLIGTDTLPFSVPLLFLILVVVRETLLIGGVIILMITTGFIEIAPTMLGKLTTAVQTFFIVWLFACYYFQWLPVKTYYAIVGIMSILVILSLLQYLVVGIRHIKNNY